MTRGVLLSLAHAVRSASSTAPTSKCGVRNAECGIEREGPISDAGGRARGPHGPFRTPPPAFRLLLPAERPEIGGEPVPPGDPRRELPGEAEPRGPAGAG